MTYPGGKGGSGVHQQIINQIPPHRVYIELFVGNGYILRKKRPAEVSIAFDLDWDVVKRWEDEGMGGVVSQGDALEFLRNYTFTGDEYVYADPPYLFDVRSSKEPIYTAEFGGADQHAALLALLKGLPCPVAISGYWSSLYESTLSGWRTIDYQTTTRGGRSVREWLWMNYSEPLKLHDYRYLGNDYRERERVKKIKQNFIGKLQRLPALERYALLSLLDELGLSDGC